MDRKTFPISIFMDLSKAFDTLNHHILLDKLYHYGIRGATLCWFKCYLTNRQQYAEIDGTASDKRVITTGLPQGSILDPRLFLIYMNDRSYASQLFKSIQLCCGAWLGTGHAKDDQLHIKRLDSIQTGIYYLPERNENATSKRIEDECLLLFISTGINNISES